MLLPILIFRAWILLDHIALELDKEGMKGREDGERGKRGMVGGQLLEWGDLSSDVFYSRKHGIYPATSILVTALTEKYALFKLTVCQKVNFYISCLPSKYFRGEKWTMENALWLSRFQEPYNRTLNYGSSVYSPASILLAETFYQELASKLLEELLFTFFILNFQRKQEATWFQVIRLEILLIIKPKGN